MSASTALAEQAENKEFEFVKTGELGVKSYIFYIPQLAATPAPP